MIASVITSSTNISTVVVDFTAVVDAVVVVVVGLGVVIGILTGVVDVDSLVTRMGFLLSEVADCCCSAPEMLKMFLTCSVSDVELLDVDEDDEVSNVVVDVGLNLGLCHKLSAPPCKNQGGNGLLVVVGKTRGAHAK